MIIQYDNAQHLLCQSCLYIFIFIRFSLFLSPVYITISIEWIKVASRNRACLLIAIDRQIQKHTFRNTILLLKCIESAERIGKTESQLCNSANHKVRWPQNHFRTTLDPFLNHSNQNQHIARQSTVLHTNYFEIQLLWRLMVS